MPWSGCKRCSKARDEEDPTPETMGATYRASPSGSPDMQLSRNLEVDSVVELYTDGSTGIKLPHHRRMKDLRGDRRE